VVQALVDDSAPDRRSTVRASRPYSSRRWSNAAMSGSPWPVRQPEPAAACSTFTARLRPVLEALEEEVILLKLIGEVEPSTTRVRIGDENEIDNLRSASVVSTGYGPGTTIVGGLGVLGPTRMDYPGTIATYVQWHATLATYWPKISQAC